MTDRNTPTPSNSVVTEAMIAAARQASDWVADLRDDEITHIYLAMQGAMDLCPYAEVIPANTTGSDELVVDEPVRCGHEAYQGYCAHCGVPIINGVAKVSRPSLAIATPDTDRVAVLERAPYGN